MGSVQRAQFCLGGKLTDIQCVDSVTGDDSESLAEATCTIEDGLSCTNLPFDGIPPCHDYQIRYMCNCSGEKVLATCCDKVQISIFFLISFSAPFLREVSSL